ncbi:Uncharacterized protein TCM_030857 [Theobroma cacao]|uniref:Uncharacterized protein n=1 Tax=Theobroma cacao TaxID=3641 RepID=A0A061F5J7_THECC|nr:Uncharacterized protein TCM_030857 [Theobroma cacao]
MLISMPTPRGVNVGYSGVVQSQNGRWKKYELSHASGMDLLSVFSSLIGILSLLSNWVSLKYQDESPFKDGNNINISVSVIALIICLIAIVVIYNGQYVGYHKTIINISILSGSFAIISVLKILFPNLGWFFRAIWLAWFACLALDSYKELFQFFAVAARGIPDLWNTFLGRDQVNEGNNDQSSTTDHASA